MTPTILIVGATGNTGRGVVETLSQILSQDTTTTGGLLSTPHRILALTRSATSPAALAIAALPNVTVLEQNWVEITPAWLRSHNVVRAFIAPHNNPNQFAEESTFHVAALRAGVDYVVRISTTAANVHPDCDAYYPRSHWAIEAMLDAPEFAALRWTSLQPNIFAAVFLGPAAEVIRRYRETGEQGDTLRLLGAEEVPVGIVDPFDVGVLAARLLVQEDAGVHNKKRYVVNGPEDITGRQVVEMVERYIGQRVEDVVFKDVSFIDYMVAASGESKNVMQSIKHAPETAWNGECTASTTSKEVLELAAPTRTPAEVLRALLGE
jgi:uncharacterized protein YbjT (DUF2867 family)